MKTDKDEMRKEYDFSKARKNPYAAKPKKYQTPMNMYLTDCADNNRELVVTWK